MFEHVNQIMEQYIQMGIPGNDIIIYHHGKEVYRSYRGYSDLKQKLPMNGKERYNIYSNSKPITCVAAMQLVEQGKLRLEAKLCEYMPEFQKLQVKVWDDIWEAKNSITIRDLFCMTAGLSYDLNAPVLQQAKKDTDGRCPTVETMRYLAKGYLRTEPQTRWEYSLCHDVLAAVVELVSGMRYGEYVRKNIFEPLGMTRSAFILPREEWDTMCTQYHYDSETKSVIETEKEIAYRLGTEFESGGAGCVSTVEDYIKFLEALRVGDVILSKESIRQMSTDALVGVEWDKYGQGNLGYGYGLGMRCPSNRSKKTYDFGWDGAAGAFGAVDLTHDYTLFYAQQVTGSPTHCVGDGLCDAVLKDLGYI